MVVLVHVNLIVLSHLYLIIKYFIGFYLQESSGGFSVKLCVTIKNYLFVIIVSCRHASKTKI